MQVGAASRIVVHHFIEFPFGIERWSPSAALILAAGPMPGGGVWCPRFRFELCEAANDPAWSS